MLCKPIFTLTWYPGEYPSETSPLVLQSADHRVRDGYAALAALVRDAVQIAPFLRAPAPAMWNRGNRQTEIEWEEVRLHDSPAEALADGLAAVAEMPDETGWLRIDVPGEGRAWVCTPCLIESAGHPRVMREGKQHLLSLRWQLHCGPMTEIATSSEEGAITTEIGAEILTEDGEFYLALETMT